MFRETSRFETYINSHVFNRILLKIYDKQGDEYYTLDMPPDVYEELKTTIKQFEKFEKEEMDCWK